MKIVRYCAGEAIGDGVRQGLSQNNAQVVTNVITKINKESDEYQLVPSAIALPPCELLILQSEIDDSKTPLYFEPSAKVNKVVFDGDRLQDQLLESEVLKALEFKPINNIDVASASSRAIPQASQSGEFSFEGSGVLFTALLPFIILGLFSGAGLYFLRRRVKR